MTVRLVAGVDSSTQSCKVALHDVDTGALVASASAPHPVVTPPRSEQDPAAWWTAFVRAFRRAVAESGAPSTAVVGIAVAAQCHGLVALDADDRVVRPAKLWNDTTSAAELRELRARIGDAAFVDLVGTLPTAAFTISKVLWLARHEPAHFAATRTLLLPHDHLTFQLTGQRVTDRSEASGTGYWSATEHRYLPEFLAQVDPSRDWTSALPTVLGPDDAAGVVRATAADELGLQGVRIVVGAGGGDQHAAALGLGIDGGDVVYSFGTSGVVSALSRTPVHDRTGAVDGVADMTGGYLPLVSTLNASRVTDTFARLLGVDHAEASRLALAAPSDSVGPVLAAFLDGERTPDRPTATGTLTGIGTSTTREEIARAAHEGVVLGLVTGQRHLERMGVRTDGRVVAVGGGARSPAYTQLLADLIGRPVHTAPVDEASARGAAVQAAGVAAGASVAEVRTAWAPAFRTAAEPRSTDRDVTAAYARLAAMTALDRP